MVAAGLAGPARAARGPGARLRARHHAAGGRWPRPPVRRRGHEERRGLRRLATARRVARHPGRGTRGVAEGVAGAGRRRSTLRRRIDAADAVALLADDDAAGPARDRELLACRRVDRAAGRVRRRPRCRRAGRAAANRWRRPQPATSGTTCASSAIPSSPRPARCGDSRCRPLRRAAGRARRAAVRLRMERRTGLARRRRTPAVAATRACAAQATPPSSVAPSTARRTDVSEVFPPLPPALLELHRAVKRVFDPAGILNPGRMYADL